VYYECRYLRRPQYATGHWTPWRRIDVDIHGEHVVPVIWRGTPYIFWATLTDDPASVDGQPGVATKMNLDFSWAKFNGTTWSSRQRYDGPTVSIAKPKAKPSAQAMFLRATVAAYYRSNESVSVPGVDLYEATERDQTAYGNTAPMAPIPTKMGYQG